MNPLDIFRILVLHGTEFTVHTVGVPERRQVVFTVPTKDLKSIMFADLVDANSSFNSEGCLFLSEPLEV